MWALWISLGVAGGSALIVGVVISPLLKRKIDRTFAEQEQANNERMDEPAQRLPSSSVGSVASSGIAGLKGDMEAAQGGESGMVESIARTNTKANWSAISSTLTKGLNVDIHSALEKDELVGDIHKKSEKFDPRTEESFKYLQVFTAICDSFGHGANDVANSIGPFAAIWSIYQHQGIEKKSEVPVWILAMGGIGIVVGLATYGYKIMSAIGIKMCRITASRGFAIELGAAMVIIMGSRLGIPLSTTHCQVGMASW